MWEGKLYAASDLLSRTKHAVACVVNIHDWLIVPPDNNGIGTGPSIQNVACNTEPITDQSVVQRIPERRVVENPARSRNIFQIPYLDVVGQYAPASADVGVDPFVRQFEWCNSNIGIVPLASVCQVIPPIPNQHVIAVIPAQDIVQHIPVTIDIQISGQRQILDVGGQGIRPGCQYRISPCIGRFRNRVPFMIHNKSVIRQTAHHAVLYANLNTCFNISSKPHCPSTAIEFDTLNTIVLRGKITAYPDLRV